MVYTSLNQYRPNIAEVWQPLTNRLRGEFNAIVLTYEPSGFKLHEPHADEIIKNGLPTVVMDMREKSWDVHDPDWIPSYNSGALGDISLNQAMDEIDPSIFFVREFGCLANKLRFEGSKVFPIDLISYNLPPPREYIEDSFHSRERGVFHWYGQSHPDRELLHNALKASTIPNDAKHIFHTKRRPLATVMSHQAKYKASVALGGAGIKTWRHHESTHNSVPIIAELGVHFQFPFTDDNAILLPTENGRINPEQSIQIIQESLANDDLMWHKMKGAMENAKNYQIDNYMNHINKIIQENL